MQTAQNTKGGRELLGRDGRSDNAYWWEIDLILTPGDDLMSSIEREWGGQGEKENRIALLAN